MKDLFEDKEIESVEEIKETLSCDKWWIKKKCSICGSDKKLWVKGNGIVRCEDHYRDKK
jgi:hypothetical protein